MLNNPKNVQIDILLGQLRKISHEDRILLGLYFYEKLSVGEIAAVLNKKPDEIREMLIRVMPFLSIKDESFQTAANSSFQLAD